MIEGDFVLEQGVNISDERAAPERTGRVQNCGCFGSHVSIERNANMITFQRTAQLPVPFRVRLAFRMKFPSILRRFRDQGVRAP
jgi:hypothetical protein